MPWHKWWPEPLGLIPLIQWRKDLQKNNLLPAPLPPPPAEPVPAPKGGRPDNGYGTDVNNPAAGAEGSPIGRNCPTVPLEERKAHGEPSVQLIAQKLLQRKEGTFIPAGMQFNVIAAAWIQAMVHDWVGHMDDTTPSGGESLSEGEASGCPLNSFKFNKTLERESDDSYDSERTQWWDASFIYGQTAGAVKKGRAFEGGKLKTNLTHPNTMPVGEDGVPCLGDNKNSWLGVGLLQELFLKEHNAICDYVAFKHPDFDDEKLFNVARLVVAALLAKIHTIDWTVELLKSETLKVGMMANWYGLPDALGLPKIFGESFKLIGNETTVDHGTPFCLTEEFVCVYRLHPMLPDGLHFGDGEYLPLEELVALNGDAALRANPDRPMQFWKSVVEYPCGALHLHNYPTALRKLLPTDNEGRPLGEDDVIDLAALDLFRDRERGVPRFNKVRESLGMPPYKNWADLTADKSVQAELAEVYGKDGIDELDLLVGDLVETAAQDIKGFAISETSFIIFLLMASRRLESDPFLNNYYTEEYYTKEGLQWIENIASLRDVLKRHYPEVVSDLPEGASAFTPVTPWPAK